MGNFSIPFAMLAYGNTHLILGLSGFMIVLVTILSALIYRKRGVVVTV